MIAQAEATRPTTSTLSAVALCADPVPGQQFVQGASAINPSDFKSARASCPAGTTLHSLGFDFTARNGALYATTLLPRIDIFGTSAAGGTDVEAVEAGDGFVVDGAPASWQVRALGICAR